MSIEISGIDHIYVAVSDLPLSEAFYDKFMPQVGFRKNTFHIQGDLHTQYYNRHFGFVLRPAKNAWNRKANSGPGLHHLCFRVKSCADVDAVAKVLRTADISCSMPEFYPEYAPDYYATYFSDPDGIRLEVTNFREERRKRYEYWESV